MMQGQVSYFQVESFCTSLFQPKKTFRIAKSPDESTDETACREVL